MALQIALTYSASLVLALLLAFARDRWLCADAICVLFCEN
jgi:hypothetical protein